MLIGIIVGIVVFVVIMVVIFCVLVKKGGNVLNDLKLQAWNKIGEHLGDGFKRSSEIKVNSLDYHYKTNQYLPAMVISVDAENRKLAFTTIGGEVKGENGQIVRYKLASKTLDFDPIVGGEIVVGGHSATSTNSSVGGASSLGGGAVLGSSFGTSSVSSYVHSLDYVIQLDSIANPTFTVNIFNRKVDEASQIYKSYVDSAKTLDATIKRIVESNAQAKKTKKAK